MMVQQVSICAFLITFAQCVLAVYLQQTVPPGDAAVCPLSPVQYTCIANDSVLVWREYHSDTPVTYTTFGSKINDRGTAGVFTTILTSINSTTLVSTATIDSVSLSEDNGRNISCSDKSGAAIWKVVQVHEGIPSAPSNLTVTELSTVGSELTVNLTWSLNDNRCVVVYNIEVTSTNAFITMNTSSQYLVLALQIGVVYSFKIRGTDTSNQLGDWSDLFMYNTSSIITPSTTILPATTSAVTITSSTMISVSAMSTVLSTPVITVLSSPVITVTPNGHSDVGLTGGAIAGIVVGVLFTVIIIVVIIIAIVVIICRRRGKYHELTNDRLTKLM